MQQQKMQQQKMQQQKKHEKFKNNFFKKDKVDISKPNKNNKPISMKKVLNKIKGMSKITPDVKNEFKQAYNKLVQDNKLSNDELQQLKEEGEKYLIFL